jgi:hypothetical protein
LLRLAPPSKGLPDCRRPPSDILELVVLEDGLPVGFCEDALTALPEALLAADTELTVEAIVNQNRARAVKISTTQG